MSADTIVIAIDTAAVNTAAVAVRRSTGTVVAQLAYTSPLGSKGGVLAAAQMVKAMHGFVLDTYSMHSRDRLVVAMEDVRFGRASFANSGEFRGGFLIPLIQDHSVADAVVLVSPSRWQPFHGVAAVQGQKRTAAQKVAQYAACAAGLGYEAPGDVTARHKVDLTAAFLIGYYTCAALSVDYATPEDVALYRLNGVANPSAKAPVTRAKAASRLATADNVWVKGGPHA